MRSVRPVDPDELATAVARNLEATTPGWLRVAVDGPAAAQPHTFADAVADRLHALGRPVVRVHAESFWRDASLRLEYGHTDVLSFRHGWLDVPAVRRELLDPLGPGGAGEYVDALRDPVSNRAIRRPRQRAPENAVLLLSGELLLDKGLPFDRTIHLSMSPAARARRTAEDQAWTLEAHDEYDAECRPDDLADIVIRLNDPRHPAIGIR